MATDAPEGATDEDRPVDIHVLSNDPAALEGDLRRVISVPQPSHGSATSNADNAVTYTPSANFNGSESFDDTVSDGRGGRDTATVRVMVHAVHEPPVASAQSVTTAPGGSRLFIAVEILDFSVSQLDFGQSRSMVVYLIAADNSDGLKTG